MTQNRPPTPSGPGPEESLSARFAGRTSSEPEHVQHGLNHEQNASEAESATVAGDATGDASDQSGEAGMSQTGASGMDDEDRPEPAGGEARAEEGVSEEHGVAGQAAVADGRSREELIAALAAAEAARDEYLEDLRRTQAEFQNFRKRTMREGALQREQGMIEVLSRLIDVVDDFELAVLAADSATEVSTLHKGIEMVYSKLVEVLKAFGLEKIGQENVPFDPQRHDAVQRVEDGEHRGEPVVAEVLRPGYLVAGRVLRPAMVKVVT